METYPVGARWRFTVPDDPEYGCSSGAVGEVWLARRDDKLEVWRWSFRLKDDRVGEGDWAPNKRTCIEECRIKFGLHLRRPGRKAIRVRFTRVEDVEMEGDG